MLTFAAAALFFALAPAAGETGTAPAVEQTMAARSALPLTRPVAAAGRTPMSLFAAKGGQKKGGGKSWLVHRPAAPQGNVIGIGAQIGYPTALTLKFMFLDAHGVNIGIGAGNGIAHYRPVIGLHVDYNFHLLDLVQTDSLGLTLYFGGGGFLGVDVLDVFAPSPRVGFTGQYYGIGYWPFPSFGTRAGVRVPVGLSFTLEEIPLEFFGEIVPIALLFPGFGLGLGGAVGCRFWL